MAAPRRAQIPALRRAEARRRVRSGPGCERRESSTIRALGVGQALSPVPPAANSRCSRGLCAGPYPEGLEAAASLSPSSVAQASTRPSSSGTGLGVLKGCHAVRGSSGARVIGPLPASDQNQCILSGPPFGFFRSTLPSVGPLNRRFGRRRFDLGHRQSLANGCATPSGFAAWPCCRFLRHSGKTWRSRNFRRRPASSVHQFWPLGISAYPTRWQFPCKVAAC